MGLFHIEGRWYLVPDDSSRNLCEMKEKPRSRYDFTKNVTFHRTPEQALNHYLHIRHRKLAISAPDGEIRDLLNILLAENERVSSSLKAVYSEVCTVKLKGPEVSDDD